MTRGVGGQSPSHVAECLHGIDFPASRNDLEQCAKENGADDEVLDVIRDMPDDQYGDMASVMKGVGKAE